MLSRKTYLLSGLAVIVVIVGAVLITVFADDRTDSPNPGTYQAVFLDNDRAYFGHLQDYDKEFFRITDVYYIQAGAIAPGQTMPTSNKLVRLGAIESHGPENEMMINKNHVLLWENLRANSPLVQAILNLKLQTP